THPPRPYPAGRCFLFESRVYLTVFCDRARLDLGEDGGLKGETIADVLPHRSRQRHKIFVADHAELAVCEFPAIRIVSLSCLDSKALSDDLGLALAVGVDGQAIPKRSSGLFLPALVGGVMHEFFGRRRNRLELRCLNKLVFAEDDTRARRRHVIA